MYEKDEKIAEFKSEFEVIGKTLKSSLKDLKKDINTAKGTLNTNTKSFENILKLDPEVEDIQFGK